MDRFFSLVSSMRRLPWRTRLLPGILISVLSPGIGCGDFTLFGDENGNHSPQAVASADKENPTACETDTVTLDGTGSTDPDGDTLTYRWQFTQRPTGSTAALQNDTASAASFQPDKAGEYVVELTVTDPGGRSSTADVTVTAGSGPVADAGNDQSVSIDTEVTLNGNGSVNPEENCSTGGLSFSWSLEDPDGGTTDLGTTEEVPFTPGMEGTYTATLTVDNGVGTDEDVVQIQVGQAGGLLDSLEGGPYVFTVDNVTDTVFGGVVAAVLPHGTILDQTVDIPSADQVPQYDKTISLNYTGGSFGEAVVDIERANPGDDFYTLTGTVSGAASAFGVQCQIAADCDGELIPETTTSVSVTLTISNSVVTGDSLCFLANEQGTIVVTLNGVRQSN